jgi:TonB family protein
MSVRYKRNFVIATILHVAIIASVILWENFLGGFGRPAMASVSLYTPADILGEMPKGEGYGRGNYKPPEPAGGAVPASAEPAAQTAPADETSVVQPKADEIAIPKKTTTKTQKKPEPVKPAATTTATATKKSSTTTATAKSKTTGTAAKGASAEEIRNRFAKVLQAAEDGTPYGDGNPAGGGTGKGGRIGSPNGAVDGEVGGVGQGSPNWRYFRHVHDVMYESWGETGASLDKRYVATVQLRVAKDGTITDVSLRIPSGSKAMDDSVLAAARRVQRLDPPPLELVRGSAATITVDFQVEG